MEKLFDDVQKRLDIVYGNDLELNPKDNETRVFTVRLSLELLEKMDSVASILQTSKTEVARLVLSHGIDGIIEKFQIKFGERVGASYSDMYDFENGSPEKKKEILEKWQTESKEDK